MIWRYHAEVGMASIATPANLVKAAAVLDDFASELPEDQHFRLHFTFVIAPPDPEMGPATLAFLSWHYQSRFADFYGRPERDPEGFEQARKLFAQPHPTTFFKKMAAEIDQATASARLANTRPDNEQTFRSPLRRSAPDLAKVSPPRSAVMSFSAAVSRNMDHLLVVPLKDPMAIK